MKRLLIFIFPVFFFYQSSAQNIMGDTIYSIPMIYFNYGAYLPGGDMADRYGFNSLVAGGFLWKSNKNWIAGAEYNYLFGGDIKIEDDIMTNIKTHNGKIIDIGGTFANYNISERGFHISCRFGKVIPVSKKNKNSGILLTAGGGYLQHWIRIENKDNLAPQIDGDYRYGYDRMAGGFALNEFIGYIFFSNSKLFNFYAGFEFIQAFTSPKRKVNFDTMMPDPVQNRRDLLNGIKVAWIFPLGKREPENLEYYY